MEHLENDLERAQYLQSLLISYATGHEASDKEYQELRQYFLSNSGTKHLVPSWVRTNRSFEQFWPFIKHKFPTYAERRAFIWAEFTPLLEFLERGEKAPVDQSASEVLERFDTENVQIIWSKALDRRRTDPEGAITTARTLLETVCKHILDYEGVSYNEKKTDLPKLYHLVANELNLSPSQHTEKIFKQILGGCSSVVNGLGALRNQLGDAHGQGKKSVRPAPRHAELAVNLAGSVAIFLIETWETHKRDAG